MRRELGRHPRIILLLRLMDALRDRTRELGDDDDARLHRAPRLTTLIAARG